MLKFFSTSHSRSVVLLVFATVSVMTLMGMAALQTIPALILLLTKEIDGAEFSTLLGASGGLVFCALLFAPLIYASARTLQGKEMPLLSVPPFSWLALLVMSSVWISVFILSSLTSLLGKVGPLLAAPFVSLGLVIPPLMFAWIGAGGLLRASHRRLWGTLALSLTGSSAIAISIQIILLVGVIAILLISCKAGHKILETIQTLRAQVEQADSMERLLAILAPYLVRSDIVALIMLFTAVLVPLIEEAVKPLAVWLIGREVHSPAEGFALGAISGAGFAIIEGMLSISEMLSTPYFGLPARLASSLMHVALSAIMGWGIVSFLRDKRWFAFLGSYLLSAGLHGLWNGSTVLAVYGALRITLVNVLQGEEIGIASLLGGICFLGLAFLGIATSLPLLNLRFRRRQSSIMVSSIPEKERTFDELDCSGR
ncbi:MAG: PrsW family intramembrane metalloprotease [Anaerolineales bacterium]|nr:PrsW family intramembrane metalloprotease [Anaerolineales bacterium]